MVPSLAQDTGSQCGAALEINGDIHDKYVYARNCTDVNSLNLTVDSSTLVENI